MNALLRIYSKSLIYADRNERKKSCKVQENYSVNVKVSEMVMDVPLMAISMHAAGKREEDCV